MQPTNGRVKASGGGLRPRRVPHHERPVSIVPQQGADYYEAKSPEFVLQLVPDGLRRVLDIGCADGSIGRLLKERGVETVVGIEQSEPAAERARAVLDAVHVGDIEEVAVDYPAGYFDCIIYSNILEHLRDPWFTLYDHRALLADGGCIVALVPNVQHHSLLLDLFRGNWRYREAGLLDATHYRFFTRKEIMRMCAAVGLRLEQMTGFTLGELPGDAKRLGDWLGASGLATREFVDDLNVYVWTFRARKIAGWQPDGVAPMQPSQHNAHHALPNPAVFIPGEDAEPAAPASASRDEVPAALAETPVLSIVIPAWNQLAYTRACIESIRAYTAEAFEIIVVDNGSTDGTGEWLARQADVRVIANGENRGFAVACNQGLAAARGRYLVLLNNDTVVTPEWATRLIAAVERNPHAGLAGPMSNRVGGWQMDRSATYPDAEGLLAHARARAKSYDADDEDLPWLSGFCWLLPRETYETVGPLDERFGLGTFEDNDYCKRVAMAGLRMIVAHDAFVHHQCTVTFNAAGIDYKAQMEANQRIFLAKWADDPTLAGSSAYERGDYERARACFQTAVEHTPAHADAYRNLAAACMRLHRWPDAARALERLCELRPRLWQARLELAKAYRRLNRPTDAMAQAEPLLNHPHLAPALRAQALAVAGDAAAAVEQWDTAERAYRAAHALQPELGAAVNGLGVIAHHVGDVGAARDAFERAAQLDPTAADALSNLGALAWQAGDSAAAKRHLLGALDRDPVHGNALENFVAAAVATDAPEEARHRVERALALDPEWEVAGELLARCEAVSA